MKKKAFIEELRSAGEILKPFIESHDAGSQKWDGSTYTKADKTKKPDPYALAWWSTLRTMADMLEAQESEITEKQKEYIQHELCGGMGSLSDFCLDTEIPGKQAEEASKELHKATSRLFKLLNP